MTQQIHCPYQPKQSPGLALHANLDSGNSASFVGAHRYNIIMAYNRTPLIRPPSESHWCGRIRRMVAREGFVYEQKPLSVTRNVVVWEGWSFVRGSTVLQYNPSYTTTIRIILVWSYKRDGRSWGIRIQTESTVRHTKCGRSYERDGRWWGWSFVRGSTVQTKMNSPVYNAVG